jgi:transcriptional regulator GlxA family with amidase domain
VPWRRLPSASQKSALVQRILAAVDGNLPVRGGDLAKELGVSPGHLARAFKREMGVSLVEYRNKKRIERFRDVVQKAGRQGSLKEAAFAAGFGSYAQFHRIYHKFVGRPPRSSFTSDEQGRPETPSADEQG